MRENEILEILKKTNAFLEGHFKLSSELHSDKYMQFALVLQHPEYAKQFGETIAGGFRDRDISCVVGPALGGIIIAHEVAEALKVRCIFGERENGEMMFRRGFKLSPQDKVLVVEDVITTGRSIKELIEVIKHDGANIAGIGALADRSSEKINFGYDIHTLFHLEINTFDPKDCPLCKKNVPLTKPGSRV